MKQYSKKIIKQMISLWFIGAAFGGAVVAAEYAASLIIPDGYAMAIPIHLPELLNYIGMPVSGGIVGYMVKSAFENREKIKQNYRENSDETEWGGQE